MQRCGLLPPVLQKLAFARWLAELEPRHPRSHYYLATLACMEVRLVMLSCA